MQDSYSRTHLPVFLQLQSNMGPKEAVMMLNTLAVGAAGGAAAGGDKKGDVKEKKDINGYPDPETLETFVWNWVEQEKDTTLKKPPQEDADEETKKAYYKKHARRCQCACENALGKKRHELGLSRGWIKLKIEEFLTCEYQYYTDIKGNVYKKNEDLVCFFCTKKDVEGHEQYWCDHQRFDRNGDIKTCHRISCTKCSPQAAGFNPETDEFHCQLHIKPDFLAKHKKCCAAEIKTVDFVKSVEPYVRKQKTEETGEEYDPVKYIGNQKHVSHAKVRALLGINEDRVPTPAEYRRAVKCTKDEKGQPVFELRTEPLPEPPIKVILHVDDDRAGHFWYKGYNGTEYDKPGFLKRFTDEMEKLYKGLDEYFPKPKNETKNPNKKQKTENPEKKQKTDQTIDPDKEDRIRKKKAERVDLLEALMYNGKACFSDVEWKKYNVELRKVWKRLELKMYPDDDKAYDLNIRKKDFMEIEEAIEAHENEYED